jgi:hypothetical protein
LGQLCCVMVPDSASILELQVDLELGRFLLYYYVWISKRLDSVT